MGPTATILVMLATVGSTVIAAGMTRIKGLAVVAVTTVASLVFMVVIGASIISTAGALPPLLLIAGYAALAGVLHAEGITKNVARRLGRNPVWVLLIAAAASVLLSNDIVIVAFAAVVLSRPNKIVDAAALYVGANVTGGLLPQGTPTNLILLPRATFTEHLSMSALPTFTMLLAATLVFWLTGKALSTKSETVTPTHTIPTKRQRVLLVVATVAIVAQPLSDLVGIDRWILGTTLLVASMILARALHYPVMVAVRAAPWQIAGVVAVLTAGATEISGALTGDVTSTTWAINTFIVTALGTDIMAAALATPDITAGTQSVVVTRAAITAGAFATPVGSIAGILLLQEHRILGKQPKVRTFKLTAACSVVCLIVGTTTALWM